MAGHTPTLLELTPAPIGTTIGALLALLRRNYHIALIRWFQHGPGAGRLTGSISLGDNRVTFEANARLDLKDGSQEYLTIDLDSLAYEAAHDLLEEKTDPRARQALVDFCIEVATALKVEGFRLRFLDYDDEGQLSVDKLAEVMTSTDKAGLACGVSLSSTLRPRLQGYWFKAAKEIAGYLVVVVI